MKIKIDINLLSNEYFPKGINTKPKNDQDKSYSDRTNRETNKQTEKQTDIEDNNIYDIDIVIDWCLPFFCFLGREVKVSHEMTFLFF